MMHSEEIIDSLLDQVAALKAERDAAMAERDALREILDHIPKVEAELEELSYLLRAAEAERDALKAEVERLKGVGYDLIGQLMVLRATKQMTAFIDAAREKT